MLHRVCTYLQLLLEVGDLSDADLAGLVGALYLMPLGRQAEADVLQLALQLALLVVLGRECETNYHTVLSFLPKNKVKTVMLVCVCVSVSTSASSSNSRFFLRALSRTMFSCSRFLWVSSSCRRFLSHSN